MHYLIIAKDHIIKGLERRLAVRKEHIALGDKMRDEGHALFGAATLDEEGNMNGSVMVVDFDSREQVKQWLAEEPYVTGQVWDSIEIVPCKVGPSFLGSCS